MLVDYTLHLFVNIATHLDFCLVSTEHWLFTRTIICNFWGVVLSWTIWFFTSVIGLKIVIFHRMFERLCNAALLHMSVAANCENNEVNTLILMVGHVSTFSFNFYRRYKGSVKHICWGCFIFYVGVQEMSVKSCCQSLRSLFPEGCGISNPIDFSFLPSSSWSRSPHWPTSALARVWVLLHRP